MFTPAEIGEQLRTQDNAGTADPIFVVQQCERIYGMDFERFDGKYVWMTEDGDAEADADEAKELDAKEENGDPTPGWERVGYIDRWEFVQPFFTMAAAERYIDENRHNLTDPRIYVDSAHINREWIEVRKLLGGDETIDELQAAVIEAAKQQAEARNDAEKWSADSHEPVASHEGYAHARNELERTVSALNVAEAEGA